MDPLDYLVKDCWLHLFDFLSAEDKQALCDTCETFHALLQPQKVQWGFELILPHVTKYILSFPWPEDYLFDENQLILKCRLVCKSWRATFDKVGIQSLHASVDGPGKYDFLNSSTLKSFLDFFKDHRGNPFIGRRVAIYAISSREHLEDSKEVEEPTVNDEGNAAAENDRDLMVEKEEREMSLQNQKLLMKYGKEIDHLRLFNRFLNERERKDTKAELCGCKYLQIVLCNTPNLQSLELDLGPFYDQDPKEESALQTSLEEYFELNPLSKMPKLKELTLREYGAKMETLLLESYGQSLETLSIYNSSAISRIPSSLFGNMKCLTELTLTSEFTCFEKTLQAIQSPLQILSFSQTQGRNSSQFMIDKFLLAVQHLPLKKVTVKPVSKIVKESAPFPRNFPKHATLETLTLKMWKPRSISYAFLFFLPNLKNWEVNYDTFNAIKLQCPSYLRQLN